MRVCVFVRWGGGDFKEKKEGKRPFLMDTAKSQENITFHSSQFLGLILAGWRRKLASVVTAHGLISMCNLTINEKENCESKKNKTYRTAVL